MRTENEMYDLILSFAREKEDILAVYINGSRANPKAPRDILQDFDLVYVVKETPPYIHNKEWISYFGQVGIMQEPDESTLFTSDGEKEKHYTYLIQFADGNRIDVTFVTRDYAVNTILEDKLTVILLDKENILPKVPSPTDEEHYVKKPTETDYQSCCNEFWWVSTYIAKGLRRNEILYTMEHFNSYVRPMLLLMLEWKIGIDTDFCVSIGKNGKYMNRYLPKEQWEALLSTFSDTRENGMWEALDNMCRLFSKTAREVGNLLGFSYKEQEEKGALAHIKFVRSIKCLEVSQ